MNIYLNVPYAEKDQAKALGARWAFNYKKWFIQDTDDYGLFARWKLLEQPIPAPSTLDEASFITADWKRLNAASLVSTGKTVIMCQDVNRATGVKSGFYCCADPTFP